MLQRIDWRTSALVLERLIQYEAVHQIQGWNDLHRRLEADRRCYAFFHPALPDEPLIFIEVALTRGMSARVQPLLDAVAAVTDPARADSAVFYSITNCQEGLAGVSFGNFLIKQVVEDLGREFPRLRTFATLSPIPGFSAGCSPTRHKASRPRKCSPQFLKSHRRTTPLPYRRREKRAARLCAYYLLHAKHGEDPLDPVARFHLANGAAMEAQLDGCTSSAGLRRSLGMMVNYVYRLEDVERNHEAYAKHHKIIASRHFARQGKHSL